DHVCRTGNAHTGNRQIAGDERSVGEGAVEGDRDVAELVQIVGADVEQVLPGIVAGGAVVRVGRVVVPADAGRVAGAGSCERAAVVTRGLVELRSVADADLQAGEARREVVDAVDVLPLRRDRGRHRTAIRLVVGDDGVRGPVVVVLDGAPADEGRRRAVV